MRVAGRETGSGDTFGRGAHGADESATPGYINQTSVNQTSATSA
jgi:hypothetical protein